MEVNGVWVKFGNNRKTLTLTVSIMNTRKNENKTLQTHRMIGQMAKLNIVD